VGNIVVMPPCWAMRLRTAATVGAGDAGAADGTTGGAEDAGDGDCAVTANVPGMRNPIGVRPLLERAYIENVTLNPRIPLDVVPALLPTARPVHRVVAVDVFLPGCPPSADLIHQTLVDLLVDLEVAPGKGVLGELTDRPAADLARGAGGGLQSRVWLEIMADAHGGVILYGGFAGDLGNAPSGDTWRWNGATWTRVCTTATCGPGTRGLMAMAGNGATAVMFGGIGLGLTLVYLVVLLGMTCPTKCETIVNIKS